MRILIVSFTWLIFTLLGISQNKYDFTWTFGKNIGNNKNLNRIYFSDTGIVHIDSLESKFDILGDKTFICDKDGNPSVLFTNCSILDSQLDTMYGNYTLKTNRRNYWCFDLTHYYYPYDQSMLILPDTHKKNIYPILLMDIASIERDQDSIKALDYGILYSMEMNLTNTISKRLVNNWNHAAPPMRKTHPCRYEARFAHRDFSAVPPVSRTDSARAGRKTEPRA